MMDEPVYRPPEVEPDMEWVEVRHPGTGAAATVAASAVPQLRLSGWMLAAELEETAAQAAVQEEAHKPRQRRQDSSKQDTEGQEGN